MFGGSRRHRQASQPLTAATANPNAATAAASAFARRTSSSSLSSAAAAAALRSRPTTPINVAEVQTKRTQKRSTSVSSHGSQDTRRGLQRSPSQSSMTERTFRSPSPHRTPMTHEDAPPVPTIPDDMRSITSQSSSHKRATSLQMQPFRVASQKNKEGAGSWFGAAAEGNLANVRKSDAPVRVTSPESRPGAVSPTSSINFSYPRMPGASPPASPTVESMTMTVSQRLASPRRTESVNSRTTTTSDQSLVYDPNSRRMVPKVDLLVREQNVRDAAEKPVKKSKQQQGLARSGSHLAKGTVGRVQGSAIASEDAPSVITPRQQPQVRAITGAPEQKTLQNQSQIKETAQPVSLSRQTPEPAPALVQEPARSHPVTNRLSTTVDTEPAHQQPASIPEAEQPVVRDVRKSDGATIMPHSEPRQGAPILGRKPSTVREESEDELASSGDEAEPIEQSAAHSDVVDVLEAVPLRLSAPPKQPSLSSESTAVESPVNVSSQRQSSPPHLKQPGSVRNARAHSASPARSARFALGPDQLVIRHEPPPRSVSPRKSAMKHSASPSRGASPSDDGSEASGPSRFGSEATAVEAPMPRKKSVRVSFDDENTKVMGQPAPKPDLDSPAPSSPQQAKRHWYNHLGRNRKKDVVALDDDEVMKPRPALPSFGSVREKKPRDSEEERPLVRPLESPSPSGPDTPERNQDRPVPNGQSIDHNVGAILSQEQTARNAANISRFREPLPPVVTSLEGNGYYSSSSTTSSDAEDGEEVFQDSEVVQEPETTLSPEQVKHEIIAAHSELVDDTLAASRSTAPVLDNSKSNNRRDEDVPLISVIQPTPIPKEMGANGSASLSEQGYFDVPGGFPEDESEDNVSRRTQPEMATALNNQPAQTTVSNGVNHSAKPDHHPGPMAESESEGESIYSDAYEDLSDVDGDGFMSLNAVVASPVSDKLSHKLYQKAMANPSQQTPEDSHVTSENVLGSTQPSASSQQQPEDDWEKAKLYWRGLTSDKRKQLEQEALEEAGAEGDLEEVVQPVKVKRKKSVRKSDPATQQQASVNPERVYQIQPGTRAIDEEDEEPPATMRKTFRGRQGQETVSTNGKLQKTMRGGQAQASAISGTGMRRTLRSDTSGSQSAQLSQPATSGGMKKSLRQNGSSPHAGFAPQPRANPAVGSRPVSLQGPPSSQDTRAKHLSMDNSMSSVEMAKAMQATLRRRASDSSESSFRRARPKQEGFGFRKSMRTNTETDSPTAGRNSRFSLRSMSPPASPVSPPVSMGNRTTIRSTLRSDSSDGSTKRMRLPTFGKSSSKKAASKPGKSRFGDSSDEEDAGQSGFRSRFAESSDEDERPLPAPAAHSMPKSMRASSSAAAAAMKVPPPRHDEKAEDSPDLPDSSDEEVVPPPVQQKPVSPRKVSGANGRLVKAQSDGHGLHRSGSGRGALVETSTTPSMGTQVMSRPGSHQRRGSLLSVLRRKKDNEVGKISRPPAGESGARMDTKLERSVSEISAIRGTTTLPKVQKQATHDNWPLVEAIDDEKRPVTADNHKPMDASRPVFMKRRSTNQVLTSGLPDDREGSVQLDGSGKKKKKFGTLRRMFKLDD
ncbi:uncharacterized protein ColSpa_02629 [Colletotrichum spaethianum]|uniref:Uncharacterized protein n=1 Tax=Colletotrichum spaethianum TaxID=700344 RepID=A0AA37L5V9_9PEZI|nr:uncharacterized protein ColSpa_02629 [Colletotrichum spaethianum]GKT42448.1 hypothetical protein ColSpa_02629 [Colletotrichum spaethianum]